MNLRQTHPTKASAAQPSMKGDPKQARGLWALATFIVLLLISTIVYVGAPSPTAGAQNSNFARSSQVELGNFWNPEGVIYGLQRLVDTRAIGQPCAGELSRLDRRARRVDQPALFGWLLRQL